MCDCECMGSFHACLVIIHSQLASCSGERFAASEAELKPIVPRSHAFSRAWRRLHAFASNSNWFILLFPSVLIGQDYYFGFCFMEFQNGWRRNYRGNHGIQLEPCVRADVSCFLCCVPFPSGRKEIGDVCT